MLRLHTTTISPFPEPNECHLKLVLEALRQKGRIPTPQSQTLRSAPFKLDDLQHFTLEREATGWSYFLTFSTPMPSMPNTVALPPAYRPDTAMAAFLIGARFICECFTSSPDLPFEVIGNSLHFATYGMSGPRAISC